MIIDKYNRINIDKLPADVAAEFKQIASDTDNFEDDELVEIYKDNFNDLFKIVQEKYPEALKPKAKLIKKSEKKKIVKKAEPKKKIKATKKDVDDLKQPDAKVFNVGDEVYSYNDDQLTQNWSSIKTQDQNRKYSGVITKKKKGIYPGQFNYYVKTKDSEIFLSGRYAQAEPIGPTGKDIDLSMLVGKQIEVYIQGVKEPKTSKITGASVDDAKFSTRAVHIETGKNQEYEFPLSKLEAFLEGKEITPKHDGDPFVIVLKNASEIDCETAIAEIKAIHAKRDAAAKKRADAPKKKVTTAAREKQIKTFTSVFKTKEFKADKKQAEGFAKDIVAVYNKYGLKSMAEQLEKDIQELIDSKYSKEKMAKGGTIYEYNKEDIEILGVPRSKISEKEWKSILRMAKYQSGAKFILKDEKGLDVKPIVEYEWYVKEK